MLRFLLNLFRKSRDDDPHQSPYGDEPRLPRQFVCAAPDPNEVIDIRHCGIRVIDRPDFTPVHGSANRTKGN
jgi:hypothetical protein